jgi:RNA polymerase sigma-70 factor (ECF subfamily)
MNTLTTIEELGFAPALQQDVLEDRTSDHALLEATRSGDQDAFAELVSRYRNQITSYIYRMTNDYDGAVDLAQETFVRVYRAADRYQRSYAFSTYIYRIATNLAISELRKRKRRKLVSLTGFFQPSDGAEAIRNSSRRNDATRCNVLLARFRRSTARL